MRPRSYAEALPQRRGAMLQRLQITTSLAGPSVWIGRALQAENDGGERWSCASVSGPLLEPFELLAIMDIRACSISFASRPRRPKGPPDHEHAGETFFSISSFQLADRWENLLSLAVNSFVFRLLLAPSCALHSYALAPAQSKQSALVCWRRRWPKRWGVAAEQRE